MQLVGLVVGLVVTLALYPGAGDHADDVVVPHLGGSDRAPTADAPERTA